MPFSSDTREYFERKFGVSLSRAAGNPEIIEHIRVVNGEKPHQASMQKEDFGRGHVFLNRSVSAETADRETLTMLARW